MNSREVLEYQWPYLLSFLPPEDELEATARETGAIRRKRAIGSASTLLRLAFAYGLCGLSLRQTVAWAELAGVASLSDVALLKRLRSASDWLGLLLGIKLAERAAPLPFRPRDSFRVRLVDATTISRPGGPGTDWRLHLGFDLKSLGIDFFELTDVKGGESLTRFPAQAGELLVGDRGYAHRRGFHAVREAGADFLVRLNWQTVPLREVDGSDFDLFGWLRDIGEAECMERSIVVKPDSRRHLPELPGRLIATRKSEIVAEAARARVHHERSRRSQSLDPRALEAAAYVIVLTSLPPELVTSKEVLELYRFRWQIELVFKRMKSLIHLGELPARDPPLAKSFIYSKLLAALLLEDFTERFLAFSPWGYRLVPTPALHLEDSAGATR